MCLPLSSESESGRGGDFSVFSVIFNVYTKVLSHLNWSEESGIPAKEGAHVSEGNSNLVTT